MIKFNFIHIFKYLALGYVLLFFTSCTDLRTKKTLAEADRLEAIAINNWDLLQELTVTKHNNIEKLLAILSDNSETKATADSLRNEQKEISALEIYPYKVIPEPKVTDKNDLIVDSYVSKLEELTNSYSGMDKIKADHLMSTIKEQNQKELIYYRGKYEFAAHEYNDYLKDQEVKRKPLRTFSKGSILDDD